jgi:hypothetical protein
MAGTAGSIVFTEIAWGSVKKIVAVCTSGTGDYANTVTGTTTYPYQGKVIGLGTIPGAAADAPDDNYDVYIKDSAGHDILLGAGMNRDTANTEYVAETSVAGTYESKLTFLVENMNTSNISTVILWIR